MLEESPLAQVEVCEFLDNVVFLLLKLLDQVLGKGGREGGMVRGM